MTKNEHPDQDLYENAHLTISQWEQVIERAKNADQCADKLCRSHKK